MKRIILTFLAVFLMQTVSFALDSSIKFVQVTDTHFDAENSYSVDVLQKTVEDINKLKNVSFVVFTGDNLNNPQPEDLDDFVKIINKLKIPYYIVLGNHDVCKSKDISKDQYNEIVRDNNLFWFHKKWNYTFKKMVTYL